MAQQPFGYPIMNWVPNFIPPQYEDANRKVKAVTDDPFIGSQVVYVNKHPAPFAFRC
jgi:hypothetical protein